MYQAAISSISKRTGIFAEISEKCRFLFSCDGAVAIGSGNSWDLFRRFYEMGARSMIKR
jgi:hypothetical protein